ncbi:MAG: DUF169 domain-containing protein [Candidatus Methanofastidiosia archaeon]
MTQEETELTAKNCDLIISQFEKYFNTSVIGIKFVYSGKKVEGSESAGKYCKHVWSTMKDANTRFIAGNSISCPAAQGVLGFKRCDNNLIEKLADKLVEEKRFHKVSIAIKIISQFPKMRKPPQYIVLSKEDIGADVYLAYMTPHDFMFVVQAYQRTKRDEIDMSISGIMPVCGCCTVNALLSGGLCISFGCKDSRQFGGLSDDKLVVGISRKTAEDILNELKELFNEEMIE